MTWEIARQQVQPGVAEDKEDLITLLENGWEPYAVTWDGSAFQHFLRRPHQLLEVSLDIFE